jgi:pimeloyl-ACP methyl ester carboxylesterase
MRLSLKKLIKNTTLVVTALFALALLPTTAGAQDLNQVKSSSSLTLKQQGSFFVGGNTHVVDDAVTGSTPGRFGNSMINQMYVQFQIPEKTNNEYPIVFVHGCCLSSKTWETTPDGRMGWYEYFTRKGYATYMADQVGRARSGFDGLTINKVKLAGEPVTSLPSVLIATDQFAWSVFRFGVYATKTPWADERFPMKTVGVGPGSNLTFYKQVIPDMTSTLGVFGPLPSDPRPTPTSMAALSKDLGGAILVGHSQSSSFPTRAALADPTGVKGIIQLETGCFANLTAADVAKLKKIPILIMEGDHYVEADGVTPQVKPPATCVTQMNQINGAGGNMTYIHLPALGIKGNSHMFMQDNNNLQVADIIMKWIDKNVKPKRSGNDHHDDDDDHHGGNDHHDDDDHHGHGGHGGNHH